MSWRNISSYEKELNRKYGNKVAITQDENMVTVYFETKRTPHSMSVGSSRIDSSFIEAEKLYEELLRDLGKNNLEDYSPLEEGHTPRGAASWVGFFVLGNKFYEKNKEKQVKKIIEIKEEVKVGDVILEKGDRVQVFKEEEELSYEFRKAWVELNEALTILEYELYDRTFARFIKEIDSILKRMENYINFNYPGELD